MDGGNNNTKEVIKKFGIIPDEDDIKVVQYVCEVASNRAALLVSICTLIKLVKNCTRYKDNISLMIFVEGIASLLDRIDKEQVTIAVDGSLYKHHPRLESWMKQYISLLTSGRQVRR